jgi:outer membrane lipoprotein carrier protein
MYIRNICRKGAKDAKNSIQGISLRSLRLCGRFFLFAALALSAVAAQASAPQDLHRFFNQVHRYSAKFDQVVLDEAMNPVQESSGRLWIERPGRFRWDYSVPFEQHIVGDGKQVWVYDVELKQVAVRRMHGALGATPAMLLAGQGSLEATFTIKDLGRQGELDWVQMKPKKSDGGFDDIRIGFEKGRIRTLEMVDGFGQTTRVTLREAKENAPIAADKFRFQPPPGVDVITE